MRHIHSSSCSAPRLMDISQEKSWVAPNIWLLVQDGHTFGKTSATRMGKEVIGDTNRKKKFKYIEIFRLGNMNGKFLSSDVCV